MGKLPSDKFPSVRVNRDTVNAIFQDECQRPKGGKKPGPQKRKWIFLSSSSAAGQSRVPRQRCSVTDLVSASKVLHCRFLQKVLFLLLNNSVTLSLALTPLSRDACCSCRRFSANLENAGMQIRCLWGRSCYFAASVEP